MQEAYPLKANDSVLQKTPFSFDVSVWEFFWTLITGARLMVARPGAHQDRGYLKKSYRAGPDKYVALCAVDVAGFWKERMGSRSANRCVRS